MAAPYARAPVELARRAASWSPQPYVEMTLRRDGGLRRRGRDARACARFLIPAGQATAAAEYAIEPDASAASYFFAAAAITGGR